MTVLLTFATRKLSQARSNQTKWKRQFARPHRHIGFAFVFSGVWVELFPNEAGSEKILKEDDWN